MSSSIEYQTPQYNINPNDSRSLDHEETILGHLLAEKQYNLKDSLYYLTTYAKEETKAWDHTESVSGAGFWVGMVAGGAVFLSVGAGPLGLAIGGVVAAIGSGGSWYLKDTAERVGALRRTEFELHKNHPWLRDRLWQLSQQGATGAEIVAIYDRMLFHMFANGIPTDGNAIAGSMGLNTPVFTDSPQTQSGLQPMNALGASRAEAQALTQTELQDHSVGANKMGTAAAPSYGIVKNRTPVDILVAALFSHRAFYGGQRTGKSRLASAASAGIIEAAPGTKVFYLNLFAFDFAETQRMFSHAYRSVICDLAPVTKFEAEPTIAAAAALFIEFTQTTGAILIIDEAASMGDVRGRHIEALSPLVNNLVGYLSAIRDSSKKRRKAVWTVAPGIVAGNLDDGMKSLMKGFSPVLVAIPKHRSVDWEGQTLTTDTTIAGQLKSNYSGMVFDAPEMDCDRACLIDSIWMPLGHLSISAPSPAPETPRATQSNAPPSSEPTQKLGIGHQNWEYVTQGTDREAIEVETQAIDDKPDGLDEFPLVLTIWEYLDGKDARSMKQISGAMKTGGKISDDVLTAKLGQFETYKDAIKTVVSFGVSKGYLRQVSEDAYEAIRKH